MIRAIPQHDKKPQTYDRGHAQRFRQRDRTNCGAAVRAGSDRARLAIRRSSVYDPAAIGIRTIYL
jgi:hypothetical protein